MSAPDRTSWCALALVLAAGCSAVPDRRVIGNAPGTAPSPATAEPVIIPVAAGDCPLAVDELFAPARIPLRPWPDPAIFGDECPPDFDAAAALGSRCAEDDCADGITADGHRVAVQLSGPHGSGRFWEVGLAVAAADGAPRWACSPASTVGWRLIVDDAAALAPLPWLRDLDGDGAVELVVWTRLPWGQSEVQNALFPVAYQLTASALVRRDDLARAVALPVAEVYRRAAPDVLEDACRAAIVAALTR